MKFLSAKWLDLLMLNWEVDPALLLPRVPAGTQLDTFGGKAYASIVAFRFESTRVLGFPPPFHRNFEEVNLRFYVSRTVDSETRRGVVFVKEIVPKPIIAFTARALYNEPYVHTPMRHRIDRGAKTTLVRYEWDLNGTADSVSAEFSNTLSALVDGSRERFIAEHYWGYTRQRDGGTVEYRVSHPSWEYAPVRNVKLSCRIGEWYGSDFAAAMSSAPDFCFYCSGSAVTVDAATRIV